MKEFIITLSWLSPILLVLGLTLGLAKLTKLKRENRFILLFFLAELVIDLLSRYYRELSVAGNNLMFLQMNSLLELVFFSLFLHQFLNLKKKILTRILFVIIALIQIYQILFVDTSTFYSFELYGKFLTGLYIIVLCIMYFINLIKKDEISEINPKLNLIIVISIWALIDLFISLIVNYLINGQLKYIMYFWVLRMFAYLMLYSHFILKIWKTGRVKRL